MGTFLRGFKCRFLHVNFFLVPRNGVNSSVLLAHLVSVRIGIVKY